MASKKTTSPKAKPAPKPIAPPRSKAAAKVPPAAKVKAPAKAAAPAKVKAAPKAAPAPKAKVATAAEAAPKVKAPAKVEAAKVEAAKPPSKAATKVEAAPKAAAKPVPKAAPPPKAEVAKPAPAPKAAPVAEAAKPAPKAAPPPKAEAVKAAPAPKAAPKVAPKAEPAPTPAPPPKAKAAPKAAPAAKAAAPKAAAKAKAPRAKAAPEAPRAEDQDPSTAAKLDLGPAGKAEAQVEQIPWGYGQDRVTAAAVDPERLFAWWEVTDVAIELARQRLGAEGAHATLALRVYDTTGLIFDGTNAHASFDHRLERHDRQWFFHVGKPTSSAYVELGVLAGSGAFVRIARSARVDFPRREQAPWDQPEWMTVTGGVAHRHPRARPAGVTGGAPGGGPGGPGGPGGGGHGPIAGGPPVAWTGPLPAGLETAPLWVLRQTAAGRQLLVGEVVEQRIEWREVEWSLVSWRELGGEGWWELAGRAEWRSPTFFASWEEGPFHHPVEVLAPEREEWRGQTYGFQVGGVTYLVQGPWEVVVRNLDATASHAVVSRWQLFRSWVTEAGREVRVSALPVAAGASEARLGASERRWLGGSEARLAGGSEVWRRGASELRLGGASELAWLGGSEQVAQGASERLAQQAGQWQARGASEARLGGASEARLGGGSEARLGGSEGRLDGPPGAGAYPAVEEE